MSQVNTGVFQLYRRGFLGKATKDQAKASDNSTIMRQLKNIQYNQTSFGSDEKPFPHNEDVELLYSQYTKRSARTDSFEFHELILQAALSAFGTSNFLDWVNRQGSSPVTTHIHSKFILDTLKFIETGKREMVLENWEPLLNSHAMSGEWEEVLDDAEALDKRIRIANIRDLVRQWCSHPYGISDLLVTLHILFGK